MSTPATPCRVENCPNSAGRDHEGVCEVHYIEHIANLRAAVTHHPGSGPKILVVDDSGDNRRIHIYLLGKIGQFDIRETGDSFAAIQAVRDELPDIITTDMMRPGMRGWETVERIRKIEGAEKVWIIAISAVLAMAGGKEQALAVGCDDCLAKPTMNRESFREAIIRGLARSGCWTVGMGLEHFGHIMEVVARTAADAVGEGLVQPGVAYMTFERAVEKEGRTWRAVAVGEGLVQLAVGAPPKSG